METRESNHGYGKRIKAKQYNRQPQAIQPVSPRVSKTDSAAALEEIRRAFRRVQS